MATATVPMTAIQAAQSAHDPAEQARQKVNGKVQFYSSQIITLEQEAAHLQAQFDLACRSAAAGDGADPQPVKAALEATQAKLHGTQLLHKEAVAEAEPLNRKAVLTGLTLRRQQVSDELAELLTTETKAKGIADAGVAEGARLVREHGKVIHQIGLTRKRLEAVESELRAQG
jgi:hypothetical protein